MFVKYHDDKSDCFVIGTIGKVTYYENVGGKGKRLSRFSVAYAQKDEFDEYKLEYQNCVAWGKLADFANGLPERTLVRVEGQAEKNNYNDKEQIRCEFISALQESTDNSETLKTKSEKKKADNEIWDDADTEFSDI